MVEDLLALLEVVGGGRLQLRLLLAVSVVFVGPGIIGKIARHIIIIGAVATTHPGVIVIITVHLHHLHHCGRRHHHPVAVLRLLLLLHLLLLLLLVAVQPGIVQQRNVLFLLL